MKINPRSRSFNYRIVLAIVVSTAGIVIIVYFSVTHKPSKSRDQPRDTHGTSGAQTIPTAIPAIDADFPDPSIVHVGDNWYAFATEGNGVHVQMASSRDFEQWDRAIGLDVLPELPKWVDQSRPDVWAPNVIRVVCHTLQNCII